MSRIPSTFNAKPKIIASKASFFKSHYRNDSLGLESIGQQSIETVESSLINQTGPSVYEALPEKEYELKSTRKVIDFLLDAPGERSNDSFVDRSVEPSDEKTEYFFVDCPPRVKEYQKEAGKDKGIQVDDGDLFDFEVEVRAVLQTLVPRSLEEALNELGQEKERKKLEEQKNKYLRERYANLMHLQKLESERKRREEEKERRKNNRTFRYTNLKDCDKKICSRLFSKKGISSLQHASIDYFLRNSLTVPQLRRFSAKYFYNDPFEHIKEEDEFKHVVGVFINEMQTMLVDEHNKTFLKRERFLRERKENAALEEQKKKEEKIKRKEQREFQKKLRKLQQFKVLISSSSSIHPPPPSSLPTFGGFLYELILSLSTISFLLQENGEGGRMKEERNGKRRSRVGKRTKKKEEGEREEMKEEGFDNGGEGEEGGGERKEEGGGGKEEEEVEEGEEGEEGEEEEEEKEEEEEEEGEFYFKERMIGKILEKTLKEKLGKIIMPLDGSIKEYFEGGDLEKVAELVEVKGFGKETVKIVVKTIFEFLMASKENVIKNKIQVVFEESEEGLINVINVEEEGRKEEEEEGAEKKEVEDRREEEDGQKKEEEGEFKEKLKTKKEDQKSKDGGELKEQEIMKEKMEGVEEKNAKDFQIKENEATKNEQKTMDNKERLIQTNEIIKNSEINPKPQTFLSRINFPSYPSPSTIQQPSIISPPSSSLSDLLLPPPTLLPPPSSFLLEKLSDNPSFIIPPTLQFQEIPFFMLDTRLDLYLRRTIFEATRSLVKETGKVDYLEFERRARKRQERAEREFWKGWKGGFDTPVFEYDME